MYGPEQPLKLQEWNTGLEPRVERSGCRQMLRVIMKPGGVACVFLVLGALPAAAQGWPSWADDVFGNRPGGYARRPSWDGSGLSPPVDRQAMPPNGGDIRDGGARPEIAPEAPAQVAFPYDFPMNSIVIDTGGRKLYYVLPEGRAYEYAISVGREGFNWAGTETVSRKQAWPDWHPPAEMRERDRALPEKMTGGLKNPLGAMALYLGNTLYRIHGTNDAKSIGRAASSGCFRMLNSNVLHLASIAEIGTIVNVVTSLPRAPEVSRAPELARPPSTASFPASTPPNPVRSGTAPNYRALRDMALGGDQP
jgi:lipoprotein-anchoring transpeptidase ErfK/SrfK